MRHPPEPDIPPSTRLFRAVLALSMALRARMDARLAEVGLTTQQAALLTFAAARDEPPNQADVARFLGTSHQNVRQLLAALVRKGMVVVEADPTDRRAVRVRVADVVAGVFADRDAGDHAAVRAWFGALTDAEIDDTVARLGRVWEALHELP